MKLNLVKGYYPFPVYEFNLPAGWTCPQANECLAKAMRDSGKLKKGKNIKHVCYAARAERFPAVRDQRWANLEAVKKIETSLSLAYALNLAIPSKATHVRIHGSGDFFNQRYFEAWVWAARWRPEITFWAYTKSLSIWLDTRSEMEIPDNLTLTASYGGLEDDLIEKFGLKFAKVFNTLEEIEKSGLPLCTDDTLAMKGSLSFALLENNSADRKKLRA